MRKLGVNLAVVGVAMAVALAAQSAEAGSAQCPVNGDGGGGGGGDQQIELSPDGEICPPTTYYTPLNLTAHTADNVAVQVTGIIENGDDLLQPGDVIEVEIELDDVMAHLKANEQDALMLAAASGVRQGPGAFKVGITSAKLSDAEAKAVAEYVLVNMQSRRATGRSDPAGQNTTRREAWYIATVRAIGSAVRDAIQPRGSARAVREVTIHPDGSRTYRTEVQIEINPED